MKVKNTSEGPRGYMDGSKVVMLAPGEEGECPSGTPLPAGLEEVKAAAPAKKAMKAKPPEKEQKE